MLEFGLRVSVVAKFRVPRARFVLCGAQDFTDLILVLNFKSMQKLTCIDCRLYVKVLLFGSVKQNHDYLRKETIVDLLLVFKFALLWTPFG